MSEDLTRKLSQSDSEKLALILSTVQSLSVRVDDLEQTVAARLYDTRPMWQKLMADVAQLQEGQLQLQEGQRRLEEGQRRLEEGQEVLRADVGEIKKTLRDVYHRFGVINDAILTIQSQHRDLNQRVGRLETERNPPNSST